MIETLLIVTLLIAAAAVCILLAFSPSVKRTNELMDFAGIVVDNISLLAEIDRLTAELELAKRNDYRDSATGQYAERPL